MRALLGTTAVLLVVGCANDTLYMPPDADWEKPGATEEERAFDMLECQSKWTFSYDGTQRTVGLRQVPDQATFRLCMKEKGWTRLESGLRTSSDPGEEIREDAVPR
jgi:hypothetical protein